LRDAPKGRKRLIEQLRQQDSIDTIMRDQDNLLVRMTLKNEAKRIGRAGGHVLKRIAVGKPNELPCIVPIKIEFWAMPFSSRYARILAKYHS